jgi:cytochrome c556
MRFATAAAAALAVTLGATALAEAPAVDDPIAMRQHLMKNAGFAAGLGGAMLKGEAPFDPRVATAALALLKGTAIGIVRMFPEGSMNDTSKAKPEVFSDRAGFRKAQEKFVVDTSNAVDVKITDLDAFKAQFGAVTANCKSCHEAYRVPPKQ